MASIVATPAQQPGTASGQQQIKKPSAVTKVHIRDGKTIKVNDHVYISAPWAPGAGEPYLIARVMEFVTASSARAGAAALASSSGTLQVRANLYLRVRDVSHRVTNDPRLLLATMHSDLFALDNVRGLCEVRHRELIGDGSAPDITAWKRREDHFYFHQLYDRYIHRFYDVIPMSKIKNAPVDVLLALNARYSFVVAEVGMASDLCDALRGCAVCHQWAPSTDSVRCDTCKTFYHMKCLSPPLLAKPAKGYSWSCAPCSKKHEDSVGAYASGSGLSVNPLAPGTITEIDPEKEKERERLEEAERKKGSKPSLKPQAQPRPRNNPRRKGDREGITLDGTTPNGSPIPERSPDDIRGTRCFNNWPYRYFGQHTAAPDVLDPHDSIYPRATTRLGPKFQAGLPTWEEQQEYGIGTSVAAWGKRLELEKEKEAAEQNKEEGGEDTIMEDGTTTNSKPRLSNGQTNGTNGTGAAASATGSENGNEAARSEGEPSRRVSPSSAPASAPASRAATVEPPTQITSALDSTARTDSPLKANGSGDAQASSIPEVEALASISSVLRASTPASRENTPVKKGRGRPRKKEYWGAKNAREEAVATPDPPVRDDVSEAETEEEFNRGSEETIEVIWAPLASVLDSSIDLFLKTVDEHFPNIPSYYIDLMDRALEIFYKHKGDATAAFPEVVACDAPKDFRISEWTFKEKKTFETAIKEFSAEMKNLKRKLPSKTPAEIVRYFAVWKNGKLGQQNSLEAEGGQAAEEDSAPEGEEKTKEKGKRRPPPRVRVTSSSRAVSPAMSIFPPDPPRSKPRVCQMCSTSSSAFWYKGPFAWQNRSLCTSCGLYWRKYAAESSIAESIVASHKRQAAAMAAAEEKELGVAPPIKMLKTNKETKAPQPTLVTEKPANPTKCVFCRRLQPVKKLEQCTQCSLSAHQGCYGITDESLKMEGGWQCDACANEKLLDAALVPRCVLCPKEKEPEEDEKQALKVRRLLEGELPADAADRPHGNSVTVKRLKQGSAKGQDVKALLDQQFGRSIPPISAVEAYKATEGNNWAHLVCAVWMPDVTFSHPERMSLVEGAGNLSPARYEAVCEICETKGGACITCCDPSCSRTFHVACAWAMQPAYVLGFEIKLIEKSRRQNWPEPIISFKNDTGVMSALAWCKRHKDASKTRKLFDMGESDPKTGLTTVQTFARAYKKVEPFGVPSEVAYALLRRARRLDQQLLAKATPEDLRRDNIPLPTSHWASRCSPGVPLESDFEELVTKAPRRECVRCEADGSPWWYQLDENQLIGSQFWQNPSEDIKINEENLWTEQRKLDSTARVCCNGCKPHYDPTMSSSDIISDHPIESRASRNHSRASTRRLQSPDRPSTSNALAEQSVHASSPPQLQQARSPAHQEAPPDLQDITMTNGASQSEVDTPPPPSAPEDVDHSMDRILDDLEDRGQLPPPSPKENAPIDGLGDGPQGSV